jgi:hypothetical protein
VACAAADPNVAGGMWAEYLVTSAQLCAPLIKQADIEQGASYRWRQGVPPSERTPKAVGKSSYDCNQKPGWIDARAVNAVGLGESRYCLGPCSPHGPRFHRGH